MIFNVGAGGGASTADKVKYDNTERGLKATNVQGAVDEINSSLGGLQFAQDNEGNWGYIPSGADTVTPFKSNSYKIQTGSVKVTFDRDKTVGVSVTIKFPKEFSSIPVICGGTARSAIYIGVNNVTSKSKTSMILRFSCGATNGQTDTIDWFAVAKE